MSGTISDALLGLAEVVASNDFFRRQARLFRCQDIHSMHRQLINKIIRDTFKCGWMENEIHKLWRSDFNIPLMLTSNNKSVRALGKDLYAPTKREMYKKSLEILKRSDSLVREGRERLQRAEEEYKKQWRAELDKRVVSYLEHMP